MTGFKLNYIAWFRDNDDVSFSASKTFWPLLVATRPRCCVGWTCITGLPISVP